MITHNIPFSIKKSPLIVQSLQPMDFFLWTKERVRNSRGKRAMHVPTDQRVLTFSQCRNHKLLPVNFVLLVQLSMRNSTPSDL